MRGSRFERGRGGVCVCVCVCVCVQLAGDLTVLPALCLGHPTSLQVAVIAGNFELGELIRNHREQDVGEREGGGAEGRT